jgi:hypothetical protein
MTRPAHVVVRQPNGIGIRVPLEWTDVYPRDDPNALRIRFNNESLLELTRLVESLRDDRTCDQSSGEADHRIQSSEEETHEADLALGCGMRRETDGSMAATIRRESR